MRRIKTIKENCWEAMGCGKGPDAPASIKACPAATERRLNEVHSGRNAGRACWVVAGTHCGGKVQGAFAKKYDNCAQCGFFQAVRREEKDNYLMSAALLNKLKNFD